MCIRDRCYWSIFNVFRKLLKDEWKPDIIHVHVFYLGVPAIILGKIYNIPVLIAEHSTGFIKHNLSFIDKCKAKYAMNRASTILPVSDGLKYAIKKYGIKNEFYVVPNVVNNKLFYPTSYIGNRKIKMLLVAMITRKKGINYLLKAIKNIKKRNDFELDIIGDGPDRDMYERMTKEFGLDKIVKFHGLKTKTEVADYMQNCDFFVQPSIFETFGVVYIEAMACGKPVIASNIPGPSEIINEDVGILVPPKNINSLTEALEFMLDNYKHHYSSKYISEYANERFGYLKVGKKLDIIYENIISKRKNNGKR